MADEKISQLTEVINPASTDVVPIVDAGSTKKATIANLVASSGFNAAGANVVPKSDGTNLVASRITEDGTTINAISRAVRLGDPDYNFNGSQVVVDDVGKNVFLAANDNNPDNSNVSLSEGRALIRAQNGIIDLRESTGQLYLSPFKTIVANAPTVFVDGLPLLSVSQPGAPTSPTITPIGATGSTEYQYVIVATSAGGVHTVGSTAGTTIIGNAVLDDTNYNHISWDLQPGTTQYDIYRTVGGATQGLIGATQVSVFDDTGLAGDENSAPITNTFGRVLFNQGGGASFDLNPTARTIILTADPTTGVIQLNAFAVNGNGLNLANAVNKAASANVRNSHDAEATHTGDTVYTKAKTITLTSGLLGAARFLFDIKTSNVLNTANAKILRNGTTLIGAEQSDVTGVYATKSQDITQTWNPGDTVELWVKIDNAAQTVSVRNFRIAYDDAPTVTVASVNTTP